MKQLLLLSIFTGSMLLTNISAIQLSTEKIILPKKIRDVLKQYPGNPSIGIIIKNLDNNKIIAQLNPKRSFVPASTTKIITATLAMKVFGPDYRFKTSITRNGKIKNSVLQGDLIFNFSGDPSFNYENLKELIDTLKRQGIGKIAGNIIINSGAFNTTRPGPGVLWDDLNFCYAAPSNAVIIDRNCFKFTMYPSKKYNRIARIESDNDFMFTPIINQVRTELTDLNNCPVDMEVDQHNKYLIYGCIPYHGKPYKFDVAVRYPQYLLQQAVQHLFQQQGITFTGKFTTAHRTAKGKLVSANNSHQLYMLLSHMLQTSDNLYADVLFKSIAAKVLNKPANWRNGKKAAIKLLTQMKIDQDDFRMVDGSGLSIYNRMTPHLLLQILQYNFNHKNIRNNFIFSLATAGKNGTLKDFKIDDKNATLYAKTGNMFAVSNLAGILTTTSGKHLAILIMINGFDRSKEYFELIQKIITSLKK